MTMLDKMKADTVQLLSVWGESLVVKRATNSFDSTGKATQTWTEVGTYLGDWQPVDGSLMRAETGLAVKSDAKIIMPYGVDVLAGDRIYRADGSYENVNYCKVYPDHTTVYLTNVEKE